MANSFTLLADLKAGRCSTTTAVLLISKNAGGVGLNLTAASNNPWWTPAMEEEAIMRIHRIQHKRILEGLVKETLKWCREITWNSLLQFVCLKQDCTQ
uniref:Uncharacterized protein n=1 Tax=Brassica oleracea var. oleracea TaxID=109376 RepID=A0A0D3A648_BRAOL